MLETNIDVVTNGFRQKGHVEGYASGLDRACLELADMAAGAFLAGNDSSASTLRETLSVMRGLHRAAVSDSKNESIGYLQNSASGMQKVINDYIRTENDNSAD